MKTLDLIVNSLQDKTRHDSGFIGAQLAGSYITDGELIHYIVDNKIDNDTANKLCRLTAGNLSLEDIKQIVAKPTVRAFEGRPSHLFYEV